MKGLLRMVLVQGVVIVLTPQVFGPAFVIDPSLRVVIGSALTATVLHILIKPLLNLLFFPLTVATFGLAAVLVQMLLLYFLTLFTSITIHSWQFPGLILGDIYLTAHTWSYIGTFFALSLWMALATAVLRWLVE